MLVTHYTDHYMIQVIISIEWSCKRQFEISKLQYSEIAVVDFKGYFHSSKRLLIIKF